MVGVMIDMDTLLHDKNIPKIERERLLTKRDLLTIIYSSPFHFHFFSTSVNTQHTSAAAVTTKLSLWSQFHMFRIGLYLTEAVISMFWTLLPDMLFFKKVLECFFSQNNVWNKFGTEKVKKPILSTWNFWAKFDQFFNSFREIFLQYFFQNCSICTPTACS